MPPGHYAVAVADRGLSSRHVGRFRFSIFDVRGETAALPPFSNYQPHIRVPPHILAPRASLAPSSLHKP